MIQTLTHHDPTNRDLLLIFLGWGADPTCLSGVERNGCDLMAVWDYRDDTFDPTLLVGYRNIYLFGWSMGVMMAERTLARFPLIQPTVAIAINGTPTPVDDSKGIPVAIFDGTLSGLNESTLQKFRRRMCRDASEYATYRVATPVRPISELTDELKHLGKQALLPSLTTTWRWSRAIIADLDRIFPPANMQQAWDTIAISTRHVDSAHLPDWSKIINQEIIDKEFVATRFHNAMATYDSSATAQRRIATHLWEMWRSQLGDITPQLIVEAGYGTGMFTALYTEGLLPKHVTLWDLAPAPIDVTCEHDLCAGDAEELVEQLSASSVDAIVSTSAMQWFNSPQNFIARASEALRTGGQLVISTFGPRNMWEVASVTNMPLRYPTLAQLVAMLPDSMELIACEEEEITLSFPSPKSVLTHLRDTGVNGLRNTTVPLRRFLTDYPRTDSDSVNLTYHPLYLIAKKL